MHVEELIPAGDQEVTIENKPDGTAVVSDATGKPIIVFTPRGVTKKINEQSKKRRKMAKASRRKNRK
jgi:hypothetical protein